MPLKRKVVSLGLERRVRPRREDKWEPEPESGDDFSDDDGPAEDRIGGPERDDDEEEEEEEEESGESGDSEPESEDDDTPKVDTASISFGALARAQASLPASSRKPKPSSEADQEAPSSSKKEHSKSARAPPPKRSSKHAPLEQTSKRPVSRMREIIPDSRRKARDPRFDPSVSRIGKLDEAKARRAYAFLDEYRDSEMADLRGQIRKTRDEQAKERLKRQLMSMESRRKSRAKRDEEDRLLAEHRRKEKELVAQGKTPFYLKRSDQKKQLLLNRYEKMSKGQVDRAIERKRKKVSGKEKKELDGLRRRER
ncbi:rRNA bioproteinsis protein rrp36 [Metarhizium rileyi]|uniref:rRNA biogenesis protein RRP36 n=1 Tax=Metarhizium rileyi (strain RCEF 4871) TaxID=1649241 RepID=A0A5C6GMJ0_METRR|nr:rRNA bioproteinsis protein rrp36 [Metarhizium rileyi]